MQKNPEKTSISWSCFMKRHILLNGIFSKWLASQNDLKFHNVYKIILVPILLALTQLHG